MVGLSWNALPCPDVYLKGRTNKRLSPTSRKLLLHGSGRKIRRPFPATPIGNTPKFSSPSKPNGAPCQHLFSASLTRGLSIFFSAHVHGTAMPCPAGDPRSNASAP